jgi:hypothetical protein
MKANERTSVNLHLHPAVVAAIDAESRNRRLAGWGGHMSSRSAVIRDILIDAFGLSPGNLQPGSKMRENQSGS